MIFKNPLRGEELCVGAVGRLSAYHMEELQPECLASPRARLPLPSATPASAALPQTPWARPCALHPRTGFGQWGVGLGSAQSRSSS